MATKVAKEEYYRSRAAVPNSWIDSGINLLYFGDFHHRKTAPESRIDDFHQTEMNKIAAIQKIGHQFHVKAFLQPGDFLDRPQFDEAFLNKVMKLWGYPKMMAARTELEAGKITRDEFVQRTLDYIPIVGIIGNHELYGGALHTLKRTSINFLVESGFINLVDPQHPYIIHNAASNQRIAITGRSYDTGLLDDWHNFVLPQKFGDVDIFMAHEALYDTQFNEQMNWLPITKIWDQTQADVTVAGHIHAGFGWVKHHGQFFGNPGCPAQQSMTAAELDQEIVATLIHITDNGKVALRDIPLGTPHSRDIFDLSKKADQVKVADQLARVKQSLSKFKGTDNTISETEIIKSVADSQAVTDEVKKLAIDTTLDSKKNLKLNDAQINPQTDYTLKSLRLHNFESHSDTTIQFDKAAPTLLIGESSQGKSSTLRALYWVLENAGDGKQFIRRYPGVQRAEVTLTRADGYAVTRFAELSKSGKRLVKNGYRFKQPDGIETETNTDGVVLAQTVFGFNYLQLDEREKIPLNFLKQEDGWFFIGASPAQRAKIIGALYGTQYLIDGVKKLKRAAQKTHTQSQMVIEQLQQAYDAQHKLPDVAQHQKLIAWLNDSFERYQKNAQLLAAEDAAYQQLVTNQQLSHRLQTTVTQLTPQVTNTQQLLQQYQTECGRTQQLVMLFNQRVAAHRQIRQYAAQAQLNPSALRPQLQQLRQQFQREQQVQSAYHSWVTNRQRLTVKWPEPAALRTQFTQYQTARQREQQLSTLYRKRAAAQQSVQAVKSTAQLDATQLRQQFNTYQQKAARWEQLRQIFNQRFYALKTIKVTTAELTQLQQTQHQLQVQLQQLQNQAAYANMMTFNAYDDGTTVHQLRIYQGTRKGQNQMNEDEIKQFEQRLSAVEDKVSDAKTKLAVATDRVKDAEKQMTELGIHPEKAREEITALRDSNKVLQDKIEQSLNQMEADVKAAETAAQK